MPTKDDKGVRKGGAGGREPPELADMIFEQLLGGLDGQILLSKVHLLCNFQFLAFAVWAVDKNTAWNKQREKAVHS